MLEIKKPIFVTLFCQKQLPLSGKTNGTVNPIFLTRQLSVLTDILVGPYLSTNNSRGILPEPFPYALHSPQFEVMFLKSNNFEKQNFSTQKKLSTLIFLSQTSCFNPFEYLPPLHIPT